MSDSSLAWLMMSVGVVQVLVLLAALLVAFDDGLPNRPDRPRRGDRLLRILGVIMAALEDALARFTAFVKDVFGQLTATRDTNDAQTGKIAELQSALDAALSDDDADKAAISALQVEIATLQDSVAAQIDATLDALANPPVAVVEEVPAVVEETPAVVEEVPAVVESTETVVDGTEA
jgi:hypothetical protein